MSATKSDLDLPGFRFHPTEDELLEFYLKKILSGKTLPCSVIGFLNIYLHDPWHLPDLAKIGGREWYFFVPRDRKLGSGGRPNRTTVNGFWKATGSDRRIISLSGPKRVIGLRKTLVFYRGRAPRGCKTDWVMNEYRLPDHNHLHHSTSSSQDIVLCKIYRKATPLKALEQRAAMDHDEVRENALPPRFSLLPRTSSSNETLSVDFEDMLELMKEEEEEVGTVAEAVDEEEEEGRNDGVSASSNLLCSSSSGLKFPVGMELLPDLQVPNSDVDWTQDQFWTQFNSPWLMNLTPSYVNLFNL